MNITRHSEDGVDGGGLHPFFFCKKWGMQGVAVLLYPSVP